MKLTLHFGWLVLLATMTLSRAAEPASAPTPPTADAVLERYIEAAGGRPALEKLKSRQMKGKLEVTTLGVGGAMEVRSKAPNKQTSSIELAGFGAMREGYDGTVAWSEAPGIGVRVKSGGELARVERTMGFPRELTVKAAYERIENKGLAKVGGKDAWVLEATPKGGKADKLYFDKTTGLLVREESVVETGVGEMAFQIDFSDYRDVDGVKVPFSVKIPQPPEMGFAIRVETVKHNVEMKDSEFSKPK